jgi:hypothetical protein
MRGSLPQSRDASRFSDQMQLLTHVFMDDVIHCSSLTLLNRFRDLLGMITCSKEFKNVLVQFLTHQTEMVLISD